MIKYGGIYTDTDAIWVKPLSKAERGYDAVASYDWIDWSWPFQVIEADYDNDGDDDKWVCCCRS